VVIFTGVSIEINDPMSNKGFRDMMAATGMLVLINSNQKSEGR
jgi:hypothetical protein